MKKALEFLTKLKQSRDFDGNLEYSLDEAISELEKLQSRSCKTCKNFYRHDNIQNHGCLKGYSTHVVLGIPCVYVDYGCIRHVLKEQ